MRRVIIYLFIGITVLVVLGLGYRYLAPFGKVVSYQFTAKLPGAKEAVTYPTVPGGSFKVATQILRSEQVRFMINAPSPNLGLIKAAIRFRKAPREVKLGVRGNEKDSFTYKPLYNSVLQTLNWEKIQEGSLTLWQETKKYKSLSEFVDFANGQKVASYFVDPNKLLLFKHTSDDGVGESILNTRLRGDLTLFVKVNRSPLVLSIAKQDINAYVGPDELKISVLKADNVLAERVIPDDGVVDSSRVQTVPQEEQITVDNLLPGIYQVNLTYQGIGLDAEITKIKVNQKGLVFKNNLAVVGNKPSTLWTSAQKINVSTAHDEGVQTIKLDGIKDLEVKERNKIFSFDLDQLSGREPGSLHVLSIPNNDVGIVGEGYFSLTEGSYFDPEMLRMVDLTTLSDISSVDYVISSYQAAKNDGDWLVAETTFDPSELRLDNNKKLYFSLEMPDIAKYGGELEIESLEVQATSQNTPGDLFTKSSNKASGRGIFGTIQDLFNDLKRKILGSPPAPKVFVPQPKPSILTPSGTPSAQEKKLALPTVKVLNGGAPAGMANKFVESLKNAGFTNSMAGNADNLQHKNAVVKFRSVDAAAADKIVSLLTKDYSTPIKEMYATNSAEIVIILGAK